MAECEEFSGIYTLKELEEFFSTLKKTLKEKNIQEPIALMLNGPTHTITVGYDQGKWIFVNASALPVHDTESSQEVAKRVHAAFSSNRNVTFSTRIFTEKTQVKEMKECLENWKTLPVVEKMHAVTNEKARLTDSRGNGWLDVAAAGGNLALSKELLKKGSFFRRNWKFMLFNFLIGVGMLAGFAGVAITLPVAATFGISTGFIKDKILINRAKTRQTLQKTLRKPIKKKMSNRKTPTQSVRRNSLDLLLKDAVPALAHLDQAEPPHTPLLGLGQKKSYLSSLDGNIDEEETKPLLRRGSR